VIYCTIEVFGSPSTIHLEEDKVEEGVILTQKSTEVLADWTSSIIDVPSSLKIANCSNPSPSRIPKFIGTKGNFMNKASSLCRKEPKKNSFSLVSTALDKSKGNPTSLEPNCIL